MKAAAPPISASSGRPRTLAQNSLLCGVIYPPIAQALGYSPEETHELLKEKFLTVPAEFDTDTGEVLTYRVRSTTELSTLEFSDYVERCIDYGIELGADMGDVAEPDGQGGRWRR